VKYEQALEEKWGGNSGHLKEQWGWFRGSTNDHLVWIICFFKLL